MLKLILESYKMFLKNFPVILLFALPLLVISGISVWIETTTAPNQGMIYFYYASFVLIPLVSVATDISLYRKFFGFSIINPLCNLKAYFLYLLTQLALGLVASAPIILFRYGLLNTGTSDLTSFILAIGLNIFLGIYMLARFNILFPLIIQNKVPSLKDFSQYTAQSYTKWLLVSALVYTPYVAFNYIVSCPFLNMLIVNLFSFVFVCFNIKYVTTFRLPAAKLKPQTQTTAPLPEKTPAAPQKAPVAKKTPAPKRTIVKKVASKTKVEK